MKDHESPEQMVEDLLEDPEELTDWEYQFVQSIESQLAEDQELSGKQVDKLIQIWRKN